MSIKKTRPNLINAYINGVVIVLVALIVNLFVEAIGLDSLHGFISKVGQIGLGPALTDTNIVSLLFIFIIYPLILGFAVVSDKISVSVKEKKQK